MVCCQGLAASDARAGRLRNRAITRAMLIMSDCEPQRAGQILRWHLGDDVERAAGGVATEENALRTAQNLDAFNVEQILIARRRTRDVDTVVMDSRAGIGRKEIGRASCRERVFQYGSI